MKTGEAGHSTVALKRRVTTLRRALRELQRAHEATLHEKEALQQRMLQQVREAELQQAETRRLRDKLLEAQVASYSKPRYRWVWGR